MPPLDKDIRSKIAGAPFSSFAAAVENGIQDANAGRVVAYEDVRRWLLSWGTDRELPPPECP